MSFDEELAYRMRQVVRDEPGLTERRMFGGFAFLVHGNLAASASSKGGILLRVDPGDAEALLAEPFVDRFVMRGRELNGWLRVGPEAVRSEEELQRWVARGVEYARSLPAKQS